MDANALMSAVTSSLGTVITWIGTVLDALLTSEGALYALLPLLGVGIAISALMLSIKAIKSFIWGA